MPLVGSSRTNEWRWGTPYEDIRNVFHGYFRPKTQKLYLALDSSEDTIVRAHVDKKGKLVEEARFWSGGGEPSFIDGDKTGRYLAVANFNASVGVFREGEKPKLIAELHTTGHGPLPRQESPHIHCARFSPDNKFIYACDMGGDQVLAFPFDAAAGVVGKQVLAYKAPGGAGCRHIHFHANGRYAFVMNELNSTLGTFRLEPDGMLSQVAMQSTLPDPSYKGYNHGGHIDSDASGKYLYISNRGQNSIGVFEIGPEGQLTNRQWIQSGGDWPWWFLLASPTDMIVANWNSNNVAFFKIGKDGTLTATGKSLPVKGPAFIMRQPA